jgi:hypothetical protein
VRGRYSMGGTGVANSDETDMSGINTDAMLCDPTMLFCTPLRYVRPLLCTTLHGGGARKRSVEE